jgi:hypothetical protein
VPFPLAVSDVSVHVLSSLTQSGSDHSGVLLARSLLFSLECVCSFREDGCVKDAPCLAFQKEGEGMFIYIPGQ